MRVMVIFRWLYFYLINRRHPYKWIAVVSWLNYLILAVDPCGSSAQHQVKSAVDSSALLHIHNAASHLLVCMYVCVFSVRGEYSEAEAAFITDSNECCSNPAAPHGLETQFPKRAVCLLLLRKRESERERGEIDRSIS